MSFIGNLLWLILGGLLVSLGYLICGIVCCITIIGIPFGAQLIKFAGFALHPFGREIDQSKSTDGCFNLVLNILWIIFGWWEIALVHLVFGLICCITVIGIPFGMQHFKMAKLSLFPFGAKFKE